MADKSVGELIAAQSVTPTDLFVLEQNGTAKKLTGQILLNWLTAAADGHGGISGIAKVSTSGLSNTYRITLADTTTFDFVVSNGKGISSIKKKSTSGLVDTYTIAYNDGTSGTFTVTNGAKGDTGAASYIWVKYASQKPTSSSHSFGDVPDDWIGVYSGTSGTAPTDWTQYKWFQMKGEKGDTGDPAKLNSSAVEYLVSDSGTVIPSGSWSTAVPAVAQGKYLWTRTTLKFNTGSSVVSYSVSRMGRDGSGSVVTVNQVSPDSNGNVQLTPNILGAVPTNGSTAMTGNLDLGSNKIKNVAEPEGDKDAATKGYVDAMIRDVSKTAMSTMAVGATFKLKESIIGKTTVFASMAYALANGKPVGTAGERSISFCSVTERNSGLYLNYAKFALSDDGLTLTLESTKRLSLIASGTSVESNVSFNFGGVTIIG